MQPTQCNMSNTICLVDVWISCRNQYYNLGCQRQIGLWPGSDTCLGLIRTSGNPEHQGDPPPDKRQQSPLCRHCYLIGLNMTRACYVCLQQAHCRPVSITTCVRTLTNLRAQPLTAWRNSGWNNGPRLMEHATSETTHGLRQFCHKLNDQLALDARGDIR